jgi:hypothetical protein
MTEWKLFNWAHISGSSWTIDGYKLYYEKPWKDEWNMIIDSKLMIWNSGRLVDLYPTGVCVKFFMPTTIFDNTTAVVTIGRDIYECCLAFVYDTEDNDAIYINIWNEDPKATIDIQLSSGTLLNIPLFTTFEQEKSCNAQKHYERTMVIGMVHST